MARSRPTPSSLRWPLLVGLLALAVTGWLWWHEQQTQARHLRDNFDFGLRQAASRIEQRMAGYEQMLRGARGLFEASDPVTRADFAAYVDTLLAGTDFVGLRLIAYAPLLRDGESLRAPVAYAAPELGASAAVIGRDALDNPARRVALLRARDSGSAVITDRMRSLSAAEGEPPSVFLLCMPVYARGASLDSVAARRAQLRGWVLASFRVSDLLSSLYGEGTPGLDVRVYDGVRIEDATLMYPPPPAPAAPPRPLFEAQEYVGFAGRTWTLVVRSLPEFEQRYASDAPRIIAIAGAGLSLLLALLTWQLATARERASAAAREMTHQLRDSAERYRRIVETADEGIWMVDGQGLTSFVNPKMQELLGYTAEQMLGRPWNDFVAEGGGAALPSAQRHDVRFRRRDGSDLWAMLSTSAISDAGGRHAGVLAMVTDVTERRLADANRAQLEAQLRQSQKMEAIGTLAGGIAHDFNNILAAILGNVELVRGTLEAGHPALPRLAHIAGAGERARSLVQQIVTFSRQQPHALVVQPLLPLLEEGVTLLRSTLPALVELETRFDTAPLYVRADATQFQQVLMNLCTNAWHAMKGGTGQIVIGLDGADGQAHVWVSDNGSGMDEATRQRVFEPFFTTKPVGQGTGLGLAVVHGIVTSHHGTITVTSRPGEGSRFDLCLPLVEPPPPAPAARDGTVPAPAGTGQHVLYVDDDIVMAVMVEGLLERAGYRLTSTTDPRDALARVRAEAAAFDLVVTDFNMPEMSGLDLAREINRLRPGLPIILTSGYVSEGLRAEVAQAGVRYVMQKEYTLEQLPGLVHEALVEAG